MKKFKKLALMLLALATCACTSAALVGCGGDNSSSQSSASSSGEQTLAYTFTVQYEDGSAVEGAMIQLCYVGGNCLINVPTTNENGVALFEIPEDAQYEVHIFNLATAFEGYTMDELTTEIGVFEYTITLEAEQAAE